MRSAFQFFGLIAAGLFLLALIVVSFVLETETVFSLLLALNASTLVLFGYDKFAAQASRLRVPESLLLLLAILGGTPALLLGSQVFRHKTRDKTFLPPLSVILILQGALFTLLLK